jgi:hypothetical protein
VSMGRYNLWKGEFEISIMLNERNMKRTAQCKGHSGESGSIEADNRRAGLKAGVGGTDRGKGCCREGGCHDIEKMVLVCKRERKWHTVSVRER